MNGSDLFDASLQAPDGARVFVAVPGANGSTLHLEAVDFAITDDGDVIIYTKENN